MELSPEVDRCWQAYLETQANPEETQNRFVETFSVGSSIESANEGARLIKMGIKTTTSDLLWSYERSETGAPRVGSFSILLDGASQPLCIVESVRVETKPFSAVDEQFTYDYGAWDGTLASWRKHCWEYHQQSCKEMGLEASEDLPLVCEWLQVVHHCANSF